MARDVRPTCSCAIGRATGCRSASGRPRSGIGTAGSSAGVEIFDDKAELSAARRELSDLRDIAMTDALTEVPNRRHFEMSFATRIAELAGYGRPFRAADRGPRPVQAAQRHLRPRRRRHGPAHHRADHARGITPLGQHRAVRRRGVRADDRGRGPGGPPDDRGAHPVPGGEVEHPHGPRSTSRPPSRSAGRSRASATRRRRSSSARMRRCTGQRMEAGTVSRSATDRGRARRAGPRRRSASTARYPPVPRALAPSRPGAERGRSGC